MLGRLAALVAALGAGACSFEVGANALAADDQPPPPDGGGPCGHADWADPSWGARYPMTVQAAHVSGAPGDTAVLVAFTSAELKAAQPAAQDVFFTAADGKTVLPYEIERFDPTAGALVAWVRFASLSSAQDTKLFLYFKAAGAAPAGGDVWGDYLAVWHLREDPGGTGTVIHDSTSHGSDLVTQGMTTADRVTGKIGAGFTFDGMNNGMSRASFALPATFTYEAWVKPALLSGFHVVFDTSNYDRWFGTNENYLDFFNGADHFSMPVMPPGTWHHIAATSDGAHVQMYFDGMPSGGPQSIALAPETASLHAGFSTQGEWFNGTLDELRVSTKALTRDQIATRYANQSAPDQFILPGDIERCQ